MHCLESPPPEQPPGIWLILWRNRTITANAALTSFPQNFVKDRIGATDLVYLPNDTDIQQNLQKAGKLAVQQSTTPLRRFENYISLAAIHLAVGDINQTFATLDEAAFTSRWPQAIDRLNKISAQISYLSLPLAPKKRINVIWQDKLRLVGTDQQLEESSLQPGDPIQINFYWEALQPLSQPYQFLLQLVDEQNQPVANYDYQPFDGQRPVNDWSAGQVIRQTRTFELPADLSPRTYRLVAGIYHPTTLARLSISDGPPGELITLITWEIE